MIDLSKAKPGMIAKFRCGGEAEIMCIETRSEGKISVRFLAHKDVGYESYSNYQFYADGRKWVDCHGQQDVLDIIELIEPEFDWADVKPGMAFRFKDRVLRVQQGDSTNGYAYEELKGNGWIGSEAIKDYERAPEHDIEVKP